MEHTGKSQTLVEHPDLPPIRLEELEHHPAFRFDSPGGARFRSETRWLLEMAQEKGLFRNQVSQSTYLVTQIQKSGILLENQHSIAIRNSPAKFKGASHLMLSTCTLGNLVACEIISLQQRGEHLQAVLLDALGSFALIRLAGQMQLGADNSARRLFLKATGRFNPGDKDFPLSEQTNVLKLSGADRIGVSLTQGYLMMPRFSMTAVFGLGTSVKRRSAVKECLDCQAKEKCPHSVLRIEKANPEMATCS